MSDSATRILFMSGSAGLGHVTRDLAIAREVRGLLPEAEISWLASSPAKEYLAEAGEVLLPEAEHWADITAEAEALAGPRNLNITMWAVKVRPLWQANARLYFRLMAEGRFAAAVGDETYELMLALRADPSLPRYPLAILYDFIGLERAGWNPLEWLAVFLFNRGWSRVTPTLGVTGVLLGELEDVPAKRFGPFLPDRRAYVRENVAVVGYVLPFDPGTLADSAGLRRELGYPEAPLVGCTIGGTAVGRDLLELCGQAFPYLRQAEPELQMVLFCGPRLARESLELPPGPIVRGFVPRLYRHLAACDVVVTQAGGTTTLELTALRRPFIYFPLEEHFEQMRVVAGRLKRHHAGVEMRFPTTSPKALAERVLALMDRPIDYAEIPVAGARKAAEIVAGLIPG
jgi:UDP:flavonoid glycosyltransferase YjiC (YdhE family)